jgi:hypothetical protein
LRSNSSLYASLPQAVRVAVGDAEASSFPLLVARVRLIELSARARWA